MLEQFLNWTAWKMEVPAAYGPFHLLFAIIGTVVCIGAAWLLRKSNDRINRIILLSIGIFLAVTELYKQLFHYYVVCDHSMPWWIFPFQLCSVPMYLCLILPFLKPGKIYNSICNFMVYFNLLGGIATVVLPHSILIDYVSITVHSLVWHLLLIFLGFYLAFSNRAGFTKSDYISSVKTFLILCCVAFTVNLALWNVSGGDVNNFYIGPGETPLIIFSDIAKNFGWYVSTLLYIPTVCVGAYLIYLPFHLLQKNKTHA